MSLFIFILQIPLITILLQGFHCEEDPNLLYTLPDIKCDGLTHKMLVLFSSLTLTLYILFLIIQQQLYASNNFESTLPWSSMERRLSIVRVIYKLLITAAFVFDKKAESSGEIGIVCSILCFFIVYKRCTAALIFRKSVFYATLFYEASIAVLFSATAIHNLSKTHLTITSLAVLFGMSVVFSLTMILGQEWRKQHYLQTLQPERNFTIPHHYETYFYRMYELIEDITPQASIEFTGLIYNHVQYCEFHNCNCNNIVESMDEIKRYRKLKKKEEEEQQQLMWQQRLEREQSIDDKQTGQTIRDDTASRQNSAVSGSKKNLLSQSKKKSTMNLNSKSMQKLLKKPSSESNKFKMLTEGLQQVINPDKPGVFDDLKRNGLMNTATLAKKLALLMDDQRQQNFDFHETTQTELKKIKRMRYKFLALLVKYAIDRFPMSVDLKIVNAFLQKAKLKNDFKAIFELMNCELCNPSIHDQFIIFRRKIEVESNLIKQYQKNIQKLGQIDVAQVFQYEKQFLRYQMLEYMTVSAAQSFWRELMQKHIDASILQERGHEISKYYEQIQHIAAKLQLIYPNEIKFLYRYGTFLLNIINNDYDAIVCLEKAVGIYQNKIYKKSSQMPNNEQTIFGENSGAGIIVISATSSEVGIIVHSNDEVKNILGFQRKDLIGKNINLIMPRPIGKVHDKFIHRYFETARQTVIDIQRQLFGGDKEGYLREIDLIVKVFPQLTDKIQFVGFLQKAKGFVEMDPPKTEYEMYERQYLVTDQEGFITNVTEGLNMDLGLNAKFFNYTDSIFQQKFHIAKICLNIQDTDIQEQLEQEGALLQFDTRSILSNIELEQLSADEIMEVRSNLCQQQVFVQLKRLVLDPKFCIINLYRIIILPKNAFGLSTQMLSDEYFLNNSAPLSQAEIMQSQSQESQKFNMDQMSVANSSVSSATSNAMSFNNIIKDFKKALTERKTPTQLIFLNRLMLLILLLTIALSSAVFVLDRNSIKSMSLDNIHTLSCESRTLQIVQLSSNIRSYINIANNIEFDQYEAGGTLRSINRFQYLQKIIQSQAIQLSETHEFITKLRQNSNDDGGDDAEMSKVEYQNIDLFRLDQNNHINVYSQPFRVGVGIFLNSILALNHTKREDLVLQNEILKNNPIENVTNMQDFENLTATQKTAFFIIANGMRKIRSQSEQLSTLQRKLQQEVQPSSAFIVIMIIGLIVSIFSIVSILYQIFSIEENKAEILSLYALLSMKEIGTVFQSCFDYMQTLDEAKLVGQDKIEKERIKQDLNQGVENPKEAGENSQTNVHAKNLRYLIGAGTFASSIGIDPQNVMKNLSGMKGNNAQFSKRPDDNDSQISEEEKEAIVYKKYIQRKKLKRIKEARKIGGEGYNISNKKSRSSDSSGGHELYMQLIKRQFEDINAKEEANRSKNLEILKRQAQMQQKQHEQKKMQLIERQQSAADIKEKAKKTKKETKKKKVTSEIHEKESSEEDYEEQEDDEKGRHHHNHQDKKEEEEMKDEKQGNGDMTYEEIEERKKNFFKTIKNKSWWQVLINTLVGLLFSTYFIQMNLMHGRYETGIKTLRSSLPDFFDRYRAIMLSYSFLRERIINNNSLNTFDEIQGYPSYGQNLDTLYNDLSSQIESNLLRLKINHASVLDQLGILTQVTDSEQFCPGVIGQSASSFTSTVDANVTQEMQKQALISYQDKVNTAMVAFYAAETGNSDQLRKLKNAGFDLNTQDYDKRTPLHVATRAGQINTIKYLCSLLNIRINPIDRWGNSPISYAVQGADIYLYLLSRGGIMMGTNTRIIVRPIQLSDNSYRLFQAAYQDNLNVLMGLSSTKTLQLDLNVQDSEGRTPLMIAASEGNLQSVKYLISKGADITIEDARSNTAQTDAQREGKVDVVTYINGILTDNAISNYCSQFSDGLLKKGIALAIGDFRKRFADLSIRTNSSSLSYLDKLQLLKQPKLSSSGSYDSSISSMQKFFSTQELYFHRIIDQYIQKITTNFTDYTDQYSWITQLTFLIFLFIQLIIILFLRDRLIDVMKEEVFQSRGILNLIPDEFFEKNRANVEKLIKRLKY